MKLVNQTRNQTILDNLELAKSTLSRMKGLLGRSELHPEQGLWIKPCNSIHTWFMKFPIDVIFVDKKLMVKSIHHKVGPWKLVVPKWGSYSVFEIEAGRASQTQIQVGDQLDVVD